MVVVFGADATDEAIIRATERYCRESGILDGPVRDALGTLLVAALKSQFRRLLTPH